MTSIPTNYSISFIMRNHMLIMALIVLFSCSDNENANVKFQNEYCDFGQIHPNCIYASGVIIENNGNRPLIIESIIPSCGCTSVSLSKDSVSPNDTCYMSFTYNTKDKQGEQIEFINIIANTDSILHTFPIKAYIK